MATTQVSLEEYLRTDYEPGCDYVDGELEERNTGELEHSITLAFLVGSFAAQDEQWKLEPYPSAPAPGLADPGACSGYRHPSDQDSL